MLPQVGDTVRLAHRQPGARPDDALTAQQRGRLGVAIDTEQRARWSKAEGRNVVSDWVCVFFFGSQGAVWCPDAELEIQAPTEPADSALVKLAADGRKASEQIPDVGTLRMLLNEYLLAARALGKIEGTGQVPPLHSYIRLVAAKGAVYEWVKAQLVPKPQARSTVAISAKSDNVTARGRMFGGEMCSGGCGRKSLPGQQFCQDCFDKARDHLMAAKE